MDEIKDRIAVQAGELFMQHGVKNTSMDEIASKLGMSKRTIYQHFTDKEEILVYFMDYTKRRQLTSMKQLSETLPTVIDVFLHVVEMHRGFDSFYCIKFQEDIKKYFPKARKMASEQRERGIVISKEFLKEGMAQGVIRTDLNLEVTAFLLQDTNNTYTHASRMAQRPFSIWELFFTMMVNFIRGISTEKGIKIIDEYLKKSPSNLPNREA